MGKKARVWTFLGSGSVDLVPHGAPEAKRKERSNLLSAEQGWFWQRPHPRTLSSCFSRYFQINLLECVCLHPEDSQENRGEREKSGLHRRRAWSATRAPAEHPSQHHTCQDELEPAHGLPSAASICSGAFTDLCLQLALSGTPCPFICMQISSLPLTDILETQCFQKLRWTTPIAVL